MILNLVAVPVILFRRTRFGNGLFAVLILCLAASDIAVLLLSVLGSLIMEVGHLLWGGAPGSCQVYYWLSAWVTGLSAYLLVAIVGMVTAKAAGPDSCLQRLRDCRWLLLALLAASGLYALPELLVRDSLELGDGGECKMKEFIFETQTLFVFHFKRRQRVHPRRDRRGVRRLRGVAPGGAPRGAGAPGDRRHPAPGDQDLEARLPPLLRAPGGAVQVRGGGEAIQVRETHNFPHF